MRDTIISNTQRVISGFQRNDIEPIVTLLNQSNFKKCVQALRENCQVSIICNVLNSLQFRVSDEYLNIIILRCSKIEEHFLATDDPSKLKAELNKELKNEEDRRSFISLILMYEFYKNLATGDTLEETKEKVGKALFGDTLTQAEIDLLEMVKHSINYQLGYVYTSGSVQVLKNQLDKANWRLTQTENEYNQANQAHERAVVAKNRLVAVLQSGDLEQLSDYLNTISDKKDPTGIYFIPGLGQCLGRTGNLLSDFWVSQVPEIFFGVNQDLAREFVSNFNRYAAHIPEQIRRNVVEQVVSQVLSEHRVVTAVELGSGIPVSQTTNRLYVLLRGNNEYLVTANHQQAKNSGMTLVMYLDTEQEN